MVRTFFQQLLRQEPLARATIALYELPMAYPSVRWRQTVPAPAPEGAADEAVQRARDEWLARTAILLVEQQLPGLPRELQARVIGRIDEFVDYRMTWDKFRQQTPPREEGGLLLAELDALIVAGRPPQLQTHLKQHAAERSVFTILATLLDNFTSDTIRAMPPAIQSWACVWLTYLVRWYLAEGPAGLQGRASRHPRFFEPKGIPDERDFPS